MVAVLMSACLLQDPIPALIARLQASGKDGQGRSDLLYAWRLAQREEGRLKR